MITQHEHCQVDSRLSAGGEAQAIDRYNPSEPKHEATTEKPHHRLVSCLVHKPQDNAQKRELHDPSIGTYFLKEHTVTIISADRTWTRELPRLGQASRSPALETPSGWVATASKK